MPSIYAAYYLEREGCHVLEYEWGFAVYKLLPDHVYLQDIFIIPARRKDGLGVQLMNEVAAIAQKAGIYTMFGSVVPSTPFGHTMTQIMLGLNFRIHSSDKDIIYFKKELAMNSKGGPRG